MITVRVYRRIILTTVVSWCILLHVALGHADNLYRVAVFKDRKIEVLRVHFNDMATATISVDGDRKLDWVLMYSNILELEPVPLGFHVTLISLKSRVMEETFQGKTFSIVSLRKGSNIFNFDLEVKKKRRSFLGELQVRFTDYVQPIVIAEKELLAATATAHLMGGKKELEAYKAVQVAMRSYIMANKNRHGRKGYDFCDTYHCQPFFWESKGRSQNLSVHASSRTEGLVLVSKGKIAPGYATVCCGGLTATPEQIWGKPKGLNYQQVKCDYCKKSKFYSWKTKVKKEKFQYACTKITGINFGQNIIFNPRVTNDSVFVRSVVVSGNQETRVFEGDKFRIYLNKRLKSRYVLSNRYLVESRKNYFLFKGRGKGHGVGLCIEGAIKLARLGLNYKKILSYYYPGLKFVLIREKGRKIGSYEKR